MMEKALDISKWQNTFNANAAKAHGITTVIARCAYESGKDSRWDRFAPAIKEAGMRFGCYGFTTAHYRKAGNPAITLQEALEKGRRHVDVWITLAKDAGVDSWVAVDQEIEGGYVMGLNKDDNTTLLIDLCERIEASGLKACVYCSASWARSYIDTSRFKFPLWIAYYYNDPSDPDFDGCKPIEQVNSTYSRYMVGLGEQLIAWQFGRIGLGAKYGVGSPNVDKNWLYRQPEREELPVYESDTLKIGPASAGDIKTIANMATGLGINVKQEGDVLIVGPMSGGDLKAISNMAISLGLPCVDYFPEEQNPEPEPEQPDKEPEDQQKPGADLSEVLAALKRIEETQVQHGKKLDDLKAADEQLLERMAVAGAALVGDYSDDT